MRTGPISAGRRQSVRLSEDDLVHFEPFSPSVALPLVVTPRRAEVDLASWTLHHRQLIEELLRRHGALLFRGFAVDSVEKFKSYSKSLADSLDGYDERTSPREHFGDNVFTSTIYPADQPLLYHNANSYSTFWPMKIWFGCVVRAPKGGCTPLSDCRRVLQYLDRRVAEKFRSKGVLYLRNFVPGMGLSWQETFGTQDRREVDDYCGRERIDHDWVSENHLRTRQVRPAVRVHPMTKDEVWFNQAALFHVSMLKDGVAKSFIDGFAEEDLPSNAYFGDGSPIAKAECEHIVEAYEKAAIRFDWQVGDVALLDNMLVAHARDPFEGERLITVAFSGRYCPSE